MEGGLEELEHAEASFSLRNIKERYPSHWNGGNNSSLGGLAVDPVANNEPRDVTSTDNDRFDIGRFPKFPFTISPSPSNAEGCAPIAALEPPLTPIKPFRGGTFPNRAPCFALTPAFNEGVDIEN